MMNVASKVREDRLKMEEELIMADEKKNEREYRYYKDLVEFLNFTL